MTDQQLPGVANSQSPEEHAAYLDMVAALVDSPIPVGERIAHLGLYLDRSALAHILFLDGMYRRILPVHGVIIEFGVRWGRNLALLTELRNIYEPRNGLRRVIGFDTFAGFPSVAAQDGSEPGVRPGSYSVTDGYQAELARLLTAHEKFGLRSHVQKYELVRGDVEATLPAYLERHPETVIALAYFDLDLYQGTAAALSLIRSRLVRGSVLVFDELCMQQFPGETQALLDTWGLAGLRLRRTQAAQNESYVVIE